MKRPPLPIATEPVEYGVPEPEPFPRFLRMRIESVVVHQDPWEHIWTCRSNGIDVSELSRDVLPNPVPSSPGRFFFCVPQEYMEKIWEMEKELRSLRGMA